MKTKNLFRFGLLMIAVMTLIFTGCSKDKTITKGTVNTESLQQLANDENNVENASDQACNDANYELSPVTLKSTESGGPCNTTVTISPVVNDTITIDINYHGKDCNGSHIRTGDVIIKKRYQEPWGQAGTTVIVILDNFTITKVSTGKSMTLNGTKHFENVSGHYLFELGLDSAVTSIVHRVWGAITAHFDNNTTRSWNIARQRTFTGSLINLVMTIDGFGTAGGYTNLVTWGINRNGEQFYSNITQSVVHKQVCDWDPCSGIIVHEIPSASKSATITYGYDSNNNLITDGSCPTRYRVDWVIGNKSGTFFLPL
ncbi:MAG: hypothetical protein ABSE72_01780 [Bacteroidales bacterium]|jgi:hypothetical protein